MTTFRLFICATMIGVLALLVVYQPTAAGPAPLWSTGNVREPNRLELQAQAPATDTITGGELQPQDDVLDQFVYLPLIFKYGDSSQPWHSFSLTKTAMPEVAQPDGLLVYAVQYYVNGSAPAPSLSVIDSLPPNTTYVSCEGGLNCFYSGSKVIWELGSVNPNTTGRVTTTVQVDSAVISGTMLYNSVALSNTFGMVVTDAVSTPVQVPDEEPEPWHSFSLTKMASPEVAEPDSLLVYSVQYEVDGSAPAPSLSVIDSLPPNTTYVSCEGSLNCFYTGSEVVWELGTVNPNTTGRVTTTVQVDSAVVSGTVLYNSVTLSNTFGMTVTDAISTPVQVPDEEPEPEPDLDLALVFDVSGSMQYETICYGCYEPYGDGSVDWTNINLIPGYSLDYPNPAYLNPIPIDHLPNKDLDGTSGGIGLNTGQLCFGRDGNGTDYYTGSGGGGGAQRFVIIEAELYSMNNSDYDRDVWQPGWGYWAVQHTNWRTVARMLNNGDPDTSYGTGARAILPSYTRGSWVSHHPFVSWQIEELGLPLGHDYTLADAEADTSPSLEYDFIASGDWENNGDNGRTRIWARMQGGGSSADTSAEGYRSVYWTIYEDSVSTPLIAIRKASANQNGPFYGGADGNRWQWIQLTNGVDLFLKNGTKYTLKIWAGGVGVDLDWFAIGNSSNTAFQTDANATATPGSAFRQACNRCNPIYGQTIVEAADCLALVDNGWNTVSTDNTNLLEDDLFSGYWPLRGAKEAAKRFIRKLDPQRGQVGVVAYNNTTDATNRTVKLQCLRREENNPVSCFTGPDPISYTTVIDLIERAPSYGSTNIAQGMRDGLEVLGIEADAPGVFNNDCLDTNTSSHCGRGTSVTRALIVMTDGVPNNDPGGGCYNIDLYQPNTGVVSVDRAKDCVIYYANIAAVNNVIIHTIGLGNGVDTELLEATANIGSGQFFSPATPDELDAVFDLLAP